MPGRVRSIEKPSGDCMHWNKDVPHLIELLAVCIGIPAACILGWARVSLWSGHAPSPIPAASALHARGASGRSAGIRGAGANKAKDAAGSGKTAYLTFDDGPAEYTQGLLAELKAAHVKATFFISFAGQDSAQKRDWLRQEAADGEALGVHSWSHDYPRIYSSPQAFAEDYAKMRQVIIDSTGVAPQVCRFPGGTGNTVSIAASHGNVVMPRIDAAAEAMGLKPFDWNAGGEDTAVPSITAGALAQDVLRDAGGKSSVVILLHDTREEAVDAVPAIVAGLRAQGYRFGVLTRAVPPLQQGYAAKTSLVNKITA